MSSAPVEPQDRLDSWKSIADYLGRDVATVRRWEKSLGLPVRRVSGGRGRSVFAFRHEIDAWLKSSEADDTREELDFAAPSVPVPPGSPATLDPGPVRPARRWSFGVAAAGILILLGAVAVGVWWNRAQVTADEPLAIEVTPDRVTARTPDGTERWRYDFGPVRMTMHVGNGRGVIPLPADGGYILGAIGSTTIANGAVGGAELFWLDRNGVVRRHRAFDSQVTYRGRTFTSPWALGDFRLNDDRDPNRIALSLRHYEWWPSVVTVLDEQWQPTQRFVNAGWVDNVAWASRDRLVISGFFNPLDGGMVAILDTNAMDGQSPLAAGSTPCTSCGNAEALRYVVLPRSEINRVLGAPFNRASIQLSRDRIVVRTVEEPSPSGYAAEALYEFTQDLQLLTATYGDRYWDRHRALEAAGTLDHPRERCAERHGPPRVELWEPGRGWKKLPVN